MTITRIGYASYGVALMFDPRSLHAKAHSAAVPARKWIPPNRFIPYRSIAPKQARSGGKTIRKRKRSHVLNRIGQALKIAATILKHSKPALGAEYRRIARKKSAGVAAFSMTRKLGKLVYRMLRWDVGYCDEDRAFCEQRFQAAHVRSCKEFTKSFGFSVIPLEDAPGSG